MAETEAAVALDQDHELLEMVKVRSMSIRPRNPDQPVVRGWLAELKLGNP